jgi:transposase
VSSLSQRSLTHLGMDVHKDSISVGILRPDDTLDVERIFNDEESVRRLIGRFPDPRTLSACYEAGPTGYEIHRLLARLGVPCEVVAPSLIPKAPGDRVKTDRRDCKRLARLHRAGELTPIRVPTPEEEAVRDLCRARADMVEDLDRARRRLGAFLLRHGRIWRGGTRWSLKHEQWLKTLHFDDAALTATFAHYRAVVDTREAALRGLEADLLPCCDIEPYAGCVHRLCAYRGVAALGALTLASEVCDWRRFPRASAFMGFVGLVASEHSSGERTRRGHITKAGNVHIRTQLVESAWSYQRGPYLGPTLRRRQQDCSSETVAQAGAAQARLCGRFRRLASRKESKNVVATAVARELAGFLWWERTACRTTVATRSAGG